MDPLDISEILGNPVDDGTLEKQSLHTKSKLEDQQKEQAGSQDDRKVSNSIVVSESLLNGSFNPTNYNFNDPKIQLCKLVTYFQYICHLLGKTMLVDICDSFFNYYSYKPSVQKPC